MAFPGDVNSLGSVSGSQTLAAAGHATRHNEVKTALEGLRDVLGGTAVPSGTVQPILAAGSASAPSLSFTGDSNTGLWSPGADTVAFSTGGVERLRIDSAGQVTVGLGSAATPVLSFSGDVNTGVFSPGADIVSLATGGVERLRIDSAGTAMIGDTSRNTVYVTSSFAPGFQSAVGSGTGGFYRYTADADGPALVFSKSRNATTGSHTVVNSGDTVGYIGFAGSDGTAFRTAATIKAEVDGTPGASDMPGRLIFTTTADGSATPTERMRIDNAGNVGIGTNSPSSRLDRRSSEEVIDVTWNTTDASYTTTKQRVLAGTTNSAKVEQWVQRQNGTAATWALYITDDSNNLNERLKIDNAGLITGTGTSLGAWTAYTPTLGGTGWAIGNGTAEGKYCQVGKIVHFWLRITLGSTSTAGAGACTVTVPVAPTDGNRFALKGSLWDASASQRYAAQCDQSSGSEFAVRYISSAAGLFAAVTTNAPFTWTTSDFIQIDGTYSA